MKSFKTLNNIGGWVVFVLTAVVYLMTIEPTASYWDCGEFITTAFKLQVGHPPGAPFFMLLGRFLTMFAPNLEMVSVMINVLSALASAFTIMFLFWTITHIARKMVIDVIDYTGDGLSTGQRIAVIGSGLVGALAYAFSDTFWFSAVEGEVYATSSLFTAVVFWAILKWEDQADEPYADRWLIFIAYMMGLSIGVHLLNLLAIPAIGLVYYFRKYKATKKGTILALIISMVILFAIMYIIIPGGIKVASWFELLFVNGFNLPFNSGFILYILLLFSGLVYAVYYSFRKKKVLVNTVALSVLVIVIGYFSYATIIIRSAANPPMDQNNPDDVFSLLDYLNREQYGNRPLLFGPYYSTPLDSKNPYSDTKPYYIQKDGEYKVADMRQEANYDDKTSTFFPRMYSRQPHHVKEYKSWIPTKGRKVKTTGNSGEPETVVIPTFSDNMKFFFTYQVNWMYLRYFMWNFSGRQNDMQGNGDILKGNWLTGINALDQIRLGDQSTLPDSMTGNKAHNKYYMLPFLLGLLGIIFQLSSGKRGERYFSVVFMLFLMTGLAIVVYLNQTPMQPRERDYAYAGSFYAFAIWIGLGVLALVDRLNRVASPVVSGTVVTLITLLAVPSIMASENWDDHDRSGRKTAQSTGHNYLNSCVENGVIFTNGDNDTFPLWYAQDVEGIRPDMRVCNLSYFQTDWYIDQMKRKYYESDPLPISFTHDQYVQGVRDVVYLLEDERVKGRVELKDAIDFIKSDDPATKLAQANNAAYLPTKKLRYTVDKEAVLRNGVVKPEDADKIVDYIDIDLDGQAITKDEMMVLDMIVNNNWERPLYFAITVGVDKYINLEKYFRLEGFAYRFVPIRTENEDGQIGGVNSEVMFDNMVNKFTWGNIGDEDVYLDENNTRMVMNIRNNFTRLASSIVTEAMLRASADFDENSLTLEALRESVSTSAQDSAIAVLDRCLEIIPSEKVPLGYFGVLMAECYFRAGAYDKGAAIIRGIEAHYREELLYFFSLDKRFKVSIQSQIERPLLIIKEMIDVSKRYKQQELSNELSASFEELLTGYGV